METIKVEEVDNKIIVTGNFCDIEKLILTKYFTCEKCNFKTNHKVSIVKNVETEQEKICRLQSNIIREQNNLKMLLKQSAQKVKSSVPHRLNAYCSYCNAYYAYGLRNQHLNTNKHKNNVKNSFTLDLN